VKNLVCLNPLKIVRFNIGISMHNVWWQKLCLLSVNTADWNVSINFKVAYPIRLVCCNDK
jgi:hypothetical protein